ncbi:MAG TPA: monovalent cation:proton antiporter-2 (CPA2) family protein [Gemmatimonadales bacterium]|nr:monovalent cation:proton antiporter-2 (CPA2) family protein [Gemmatimonadales bacterium]
MLDILIVLAAAVIVVPIFRRFRASAVLGYLVAGSAIGPHGLDLLRGPRAVTALADLGVIFLLFSIGLGLSVERLSSLRRYVFGLGTLQVVITTLAITLTLRLAGVSGDAALVLGAGLALSSSAIVLQGLVERREIATLQGRVAFAVLLLQDLAVVPLLTLVPLLAGSGQGLGMALGLAFLKAAATLVVIVAIGRLALRPVLRAVARGGTPELFTGIVLLLVLGIGWVTEQAGLSMALGAFLAGLLVAETEYRPQVESDVQPFRGLLLALFFMTVGMGIDAGLLWRHAPLLVGLLAALLVGKALILAGLCRAFGLSLGMGAGIGLMLAQSGEFAFVLFTLARGRGVLPAEAAQTAILLVGLSMAATPALLTAARMVFRRHHQAAGAAAALGPETRELRDHVVIAGFGRVGQTLALLLESRLVPYLALDLDAERVAEARRRELPVYFGDASRAEVLRAAGIEQARMAAITLDQPDAAARSVQVLRAMSPDLPVLVRARDVAQAEQLAGAGATEVVPEIVEGSLQLGEMLLRRLGATRDEVDQVLDEFRGRTYSRLSNLIRPQPVELGPSVGSDQV